MGIVYQQGNYNKSSWVGPCVVRRRGVLYLLDEPSVGLHPKDIQILNHVFSQLIDNCATLIIIEHDLDVILNADYVIDLGPKGCELGGKVVATETPNEVAANPIVLMVNT